MSRPKLQQVRRAPQNRKDTQLKCASHIVVVFGDPDLLLPVGAISAAKVKSICHAGDPVCTGTGNIAAHLTYGQDAQSAASFLVGQSGLAKVA